MSDEPAGLDILGFCELEFELAQFVAKPSGFPPLQQYTTSIYPRCDCELDSLLSLLLCPKRAKRRQRRGSQEVGSMRNIRYKGVPGRTHARGGGYGCRKTTG